MYGVWFAGFIYDQPRIINKITIVTLVTTITPFTKADSRVPLISRMLSKKRIKTAGTFIIPLMAGFVGSISKGEWHH